MCASSFSLEICCDGAMFLYLSMFSDACGAPITLTGGRTIVLHFHAVFSLSKRMMTSSRMIMPDPFDGMCSRSPHIISAGST